MTDIRTRASTAKLELRETEAAFDAVRGAMIDALIATSPTEDRTREALYLGVQSLDAVRKALRQVIDAGALDEAAAALREQFKIVA